MFGRLKRLGREFRQTWKSPQECDGWCKSSYVSLYARHVLVKKVAIFLTETSGKATAAAVEYVFDCEC